MANWGANHGVLTIGHVGADFITLAAMLRIPVCMHNVEEAKIYRPSAGRARHGYEGQDYRACQNYGPPLMVCPVGRLTGPTGTSAVGRISARHPATFMEFYENEVILVLDCGATNVRAIAVDRQGKLSPAPQRPTPAISPRRTARGTSGRWRPFCNASPTAVGASAELASCTVRGITVTTFGVDGALVDEQGPALPDISWKCPRTAAVMENIGRLCPAAPAGDRRRRRICFNTLYKLMWLKENHPQLLAKAHAWLFISSLINHRLTGEFTTDITMAGTSQMLDIHQRDFSPRFCRRPGCRAACSRAG
jgi:hypothetical protein